MALIPDGPMPVHIAEKLRQRLEDGINEPRLCAVVTIDSKGELSIYSTWDRASDHGKLLNGAIATAFVERMNDRSN